MFACSVFIFDRFGWILEGLFWSVGCCVGLAWRVTCTFEAIATLRVCCTTLSGRFERPIHGGSYESSRVDLELSGRSGAFDSFVIHSVNRHHDSHIASSGDIKKREQGKHHGGSTSRLVVCCPPSRPASTGIKRDLI